MSGSGNDADSARLTRAHVLPLAVFLAFLPLGQLVSAAIGWDHPDAPWWRRDPSHWIYPLQSAVCLTILFRHWRDYRFDWSWKWASVGVAMGAVGIGLWLLPTTLYDRLGMQGESGGLPEWLGFAARTEGFDPRIFEHPAAVACTVFLRFVRAVVVVALVEEIFWRGFLMRWLCDTEGDWWKQPFGKGSWRSCLIVTGLFTIAHAPVDYAGALAYGLLTWVFCVWSKNLGACVIMHATANLLMGVYILAYGKYGLW
jgi:CAAX prenyl protease-like protein